MRINSSPFFSRTTTDGTIHYIKENNIYYIGSKKFDNDKDVFDLFPKGVHVEPMISTLMNIEMIMHPVIYIYNNSERFHFYCEGINSIASEKIIAIDKERIELGKKLNLNIPSIVETLKAHHEHLNSDIYPGSLMTILTKTKPFINSNILFNRSEQQRYITEEVPFRLVPLYLLGKDLGLKMDNTKSIIEKSNSLFNTNYYKNGRYISISDINQFSNDNRI